MHARAHTHTHARNHTHTHPHTPRYAHEGILRCARAIRDHLDDLTLLDQLLFGGRDAAPAPPGSRRARELAGEGAGASGAAAAAAAERLRAALKGRDCRGWKLMITGHSLGGCLGMSRGAWVPQSFASPPVPHKAWAAPLPALRRVWPR
jgi:hypothetical protein